MGMDRVGDLEISHDPAFQRREWTAQRVGWVVWLAVIVAALAGLMGEGPMSDATAGADGGPLQVEYHRFVRHAAPETIRIHLRPGAVQGKQARVFVSREYLEGLQIEDVTPELSSMEAVQDGTVYVFDLGAAGAPATIVFDVQHEPMGLTDARVRLGEQEAVSFSQFVYP